LAAEEVQIEAAAESAVSDRVAAQKPFLSVGVTGIDTVRCRLVAVSCLLVEWVRAIDIAVYCIASINSIEGLRMIVTEAEVVDVLRLTTALSSLLPVRGVTILLTKAVDIVVRHHISDEFQELIFIDNDMAVRREELLTSAGAGDLELE
jgi:hypothetical protein